VRAGDPMRLMLQEVKFVKRARDLFNIDLADSGTTNGACKQRFGKTTLDDRNSRKIQQYPKRSCFSPDHERGQKRKPLSLVVGMISSCSTIAEPLLRQMLQLQQQAGDERLGSLDVVLVENGLDESTGQLYCVFQACKSNQKKAFPWMAFQLQVQVTSAKIAVRQIYLS
jgi:hypothetical protein